MALSAKLAMRQGQSMVLTPQLLQAIKLLQMPNAELAAFIEVIGSTVGQIVTDADKKTDVQLKVRSFWSMIHGLVSINLLAPPSAHGGVTQDQMNKMILKDFISGFIKGLTE